MNVQNPIYPTGEPISALASSSDVSKMALDETNLSVLGLRVLDVPWELEERTHVQVCHVDTPAREADVGVLGVRTSHHMTIVYNVFNLYLRNLRT